jgi:haloalkane dehalogenase
MCACPTTVPSKRNTAGRRRIAAVPEFVRTPEDAFAGLPDFPFDPHYREVEDLRLAHIDEGEGPPVLFMHGEPTWSFLWRHLIGPVCDAGYRAIAPDMVGFGRSDKPVDIGWYSYDRHVAYAATILEHLDLRGATIVVHDWGGPIGLRLAVEHPDRIERIVILNTGLFTYERGVAGVRGLHRPHGGPADRHADPRRLSHRSR